MWGLHDRTEGYLQVHAIPSLPICAATNSQIMVTCGVHARAQHMGCPPLQLEAAMNRHAQYKCCPTQPNLLHAVCAPAFPCASKVAEMLEGRVARSVLPQFRHRLHASSRISHFVDLYVKLFTHAWRSPGHYICDDA